MGNRAASQPVHSRLSRDFPFQASALSAGRTTRKFPLRRTNEDWQAASNPTGPDFRRGCLCPGTRPAVDLDIPDMDPEQARELISTGLDGKLIGTHTPESLLGGTAHLGPCQPDTLNRPLNPDRHLGRMRINPFEGQVAQQNNGAP